MKILSLKCFLLVEFIIYFLIILSDFEVINFLFDISYLKFASVCLCFLYGSFYCCFYLNYKHSIYINSWLKSILFSCIADYFLLLSDRFILGIFFFLIVQFYYCKILEQNILLLVVCGTCCFSILSSLAALFVFKVDFTAYLASYYLGFSLINIFSLWASRDKWISWGVILLFLCDFHVGLSNLYSYFILNSESLLTLWIIAAPRFIWLFYIPAQICVVMSGIRKDKILLQG